MENSIKEIIKTLISVIEEKDPYMKGHAERVATNCVRFCQKIGLSQTETNRLYLAGLLHDIGTVYIPPNIILKKEPLSEAEMEIIKKHPLISEKIISKHNIFKEILPIVRHHHESFDGSGYPDGLVGGNIPMGARILSIVNSYDAMTSSRPHRPSFSTEEALEEIQRNVGNQFDKDLAEDYVAFVRADETAPESESVDVSEEVIEVEEDEISKPSEETVEVAEDNEDKAKEEKIETLDKIITKILHRFKSGDLDLPVLPKVVQEMQRVMSQPNTSVNTLAEIVEKDAVISVRLISVANSPMYRAAEKIHTVIQAIPRLGIKETQNVISTIANKSVYSTKNPEFKKLMEDLWMHSLATAYIARIIAQKIAPKEMETYFLMGLTHDIAKALILRGLDLLVPQGNSLNMNELEQKLQEFHTGFGKTILKHWGFPENFSRIALLHQGPAFRDSTDREILAINLAGNIAKNAGYGSSDNGKIELESLDSARFLELDSGQLVDINDKASALMEDVKNIF